MILSSKESQCTIKILELLESGETKYGIFFRKTKFSHTTVQKVLKWLVEKRFVKRRDIGHMKVDYEITEKGREFLESLLIVKNLL